ncbi:MAG TPA: WD40 repeat domain-containing protein, partial [Pirellulaceae bacterium]|nr:WD40 repeat domain-containing protein [Pirellulaceae bacterium]
DPRGERVFASDTAGRARVWNFRTGQPTTCWLDHETRVESLAWSADGGRIATATDDGELSLWSLESTTHQRLPAVHFVALSQDERRLVALLDDGRAQVWDLASRSLVDETKVTDESLLNAVWHPDGRQVVLVSDHTPPQMHLWRPKLSPSDQADSDLIRLPFAEHGLTKDFVFTDQGRRIAVPHQNGLWLLELDSTKPHEQRVKLLHAAPGPERQELRWAADDSQIILFRSPALAYHDVPMRVWDSRTGSRRFEAWLPLGQVTHQLHYDVARSKLWACGSFGVQCWDTQNWITEPRTFPDAHGEVVDIGLDTAGRYLATVGKDDLVRCLDTTSGDSVGTPFRISGQPLTIAWTADGLALLVVTRRDGAQLWDWYCGQPLSPRFGAETPIEQAVFSRTLSTAVVVSAGPARHALLLPLPPPDARPWKTLSTEARRHSGFYVAPDTGRNQRLTSAEWNGVSTSVERNEAAELRASGELKVESRSGRGGE